MRLRKIVWIVGIGMFILGGAIVGYGIIFQNKKTSETLFPEKTSKPAPFSPSSNFTPFTFRLENIPAERKHVWRKFRTQLTPAEERTIVKSLASVKVNIDKKFHFDYYFDMFAGTRETQEENDMAFHLSTEKGKFFVRINNFSDLRRFEYEKESMLIINETVPNLAPRPLVLGNLPEGGKFLIVSFMESNWHDRLKVENQKLLAKYLAQLHQKKSTNRKFGFHTGKNNQWKDNWATFFLENRWQPLWKRVLEKYSQDPELKKWGTIIGEKVIPDLLGKLPVEPVLLHGNLDFDAWDINPQTNQPWLFGVHCYYGHNEMDLSLIRYYWPQGKFPELGDKEPVGEFYQSEFLAEYQKYHSLLPGFEERKTLYRLYDWLLRQISRSGHPHEKFSQKTLIKLKKLAQNYN